MAKKKRGRGERNWVGEEDTQTSLPTSADALEQSVFPADNGVIMVHGHPCIIAADGKLERIDE